MYLKHEKIIYLLLFLDNVASSLEKNKVPITIEPNYSGIHIHLPITKQTFHDLINSYKDRKVLILFKIRIFDFKTF